MREQIINFVTRIALVNNVILILAYENTWPLSFADSWALLYATYTNAPINVKPEGGGLGIGWGF